MRYVYVVLCILTGMALSSAAGTDKLVGKRHGPALVWQVTADVEDVVETLRLVIEERGMVITYTSHASDMLQRTGASAGFEDLVYEYAQILLFCKVGESHQLVRANPHNIVLCPFSIAVYNLIETPEVVYLSFRQPFEAEPMVADVTRLQKSIIQQTIADIE